jgi:hypothetical protein
MDMAEQKAVTLLREQVRDGFRWLDGIAADLTSEDAHWKPPGLALPAGAVYAHVVTAMDAVVNAILKGGAPLFVAEWAGRTGMSEPPPQPDPSKPGMADWTAWSWTVSIDLGMLRQYSRAVHAAIDRYLEALSDEDLDRTIDMSSFGIGWVTVSFMLNNAVLGHAFSHGGEISCLKGMRGKKGSL